MTTVVLCEKPDQARVHANLFGIEESSRGYYKAKNGWIFTYSIGHMIEQLEPGKLNPLWEKWSLDALPIIPEVWKFAACDGKGEQLRTVIGLLKKADEIIIATDCGREGELIGRELIELSGNRKHKLMRFWSSALDEKSLRAAWNALRPGSEFDTLHEAALIRSRFDYMWGMTNSRGATLSLAAPKVVYPVGRVQTPVLNLVVQRHLAIANFTPKVFFTLSAQVDTAAGSLEMVYEPKSDESRIWDMSQAEKLAAAVAGTKGPLGVDSSDRKESPPKFPSLTDLQKRASRKWQWTLEKTLQVCQALYEGKYISYPRSECNIMPEEQMGDVPDIVEGITASGWVKALAVTGNATPLYRKDRFKPESDIQKDFDHHAVLPTKNVPQNLGGDERQMYELIALWFVRALAPDYEYNQVDVRLKAGGIFLTAKGVTPMRIGFKALEGKVEDEDEADDKKADSRTLPPVKDGMDAAVDRVNIKQGKTSAPPYYTEGTLLEDMISVHKFVKNPEHRARLKETSGLGTVATRANIIKELRGRKLIVAGNKKGTIDASASALALIQALPEILRDPGQTAVWEDCMDNVRKGTVSYQDAMRAAEGAVRRCAELFQLKGISPARAAFSEAHAEALTPVLEFKGFAASCPLCESPMSYVAKGKYGPFWGCTVRECKGILKAGPDGKPIPKAAASTGEKCPKCKKHLMVLRQGSRGAFWACSGYPKCKHTQPVDGEK